MATVDCRTGEVIYSAEELEAIALREAQRALPKIPKAITRRQCALQLRAMGMITIAEAKMMTKDGTPPAAIQGYFDTMAEADRDMAEIDFAAINYFRNNPLITALMTANGLTKSDIDNFFIAAAQL
jgi:hypothetical protein